MRTVWRAALATLFGKIVFVAGCGTTPAPVFYTLNAGGVPPAAASSLSVVVGPVTLPEAVDRPQLVVSASGNRVKIEEFHRWAEPLKTEIPRVIAAQLGRELGTGNTASSSQLAIADPDYRVVVDIQRFDSRRGEEVVVEALWTVRARSGSSRTGRARARETISGASYDSLVAAHGRALATVSRKIGEAIQALQR